MKVIVAGGRDFDDKKRLYETLDELFWDPNRDCMRVDVKLVSGGAKGADTLCEEYAKSWDIPSLVFPANWDKHGRAAGIIRNCDMASYADVLVAFWDGESKGTKHMIHEMMRLCKETHVYFYKIEEDSHDSND